MLIDQEQSIPSREIKKTKGLKLILGIELAFGSCLTQATTIKSKEIPIQVKEVIIRLENSPVLTFELWAKSDFLFIYV